ncbi:hypothetical protein EB796_025234 [Bugula neritina]|uniref:Uncharacterized protein n=1 Tax=Bugula neritina TaxID=10212 RepID=A0A7J7IR87_BUGNE|nr:hypothetical protein EB796_025234 [Bugula neritina]
MTLEPVRQPTHYIDCLKNSIGGINKNPTQATVATTSAPDAARNVIAEVDGGSRSQGYGYCNIPKHSAPSHSEEAQPVPLPRTKTRHLSKNAPINQKQQEAVDEPGQET